MTHTRLTHTRYAPAACLVISCLLWACTRSGELPPTPYTCTPRMNDALQECLIQNPELTYWELHINQVNDYFDRAASIILLYGGTRPLSRSPSGIAVRGDKDTYIHVYSGMEAYCHPETPVKWPDAPQARRPQQKFWLIKDRGDPQLHVTPADSSLQSPFKAVTRYLKPEELQASSAHDSLCKKYPMTRVR